MMDSEGLHFISHDPGDGLGSARATGEDARGSGGDGDHRDGSGAAGDGVQQSTGDPSRECPRGALPRVEPLRLVTTVDEGVILGKWCHEEEMWDYLRTPGFQKRSSTTRSSR